MAAGPLWLICAAATVLCSAGAPDPYDELPADHRMGVDLALQQLDSHAGVLHHFRFLRSQEKSDMDSGFGVRFFYHHFYLKPTTCAKGTASSNRKCAFRNDRPLIDCAVCYKTADNQVELVPKPYVHCIQRPRLTEGMRTTRIEHCRKMSYNSGAPTLLAISTDPQ